MERVRIRTIPEAPVEGMVHFKKLGRGALRLKGHGIIRGGTAFWAYPSEISPAFRDTVVPFDEKAAKQARVIPDEEIPAVKTGYTLQKRETSSFYDVLDSQGKKVNEKALRKEDAEEYVKSLE